VPTCPSPNVQFIVPGGTPPATVAANPTVPPAVGIAGEVEIADTVGNDATETVAAPFAEPPPESAS